MNDTTPQISGNIINLTPSTPLTATNDIQVPNNFPTTVQNKAEYTVSPSLTKEGYEKWTKSIKYTDEDGDGCYIQFGLNPVSGLADVAIMPTNDNFDGMNCSTGSSYNGIDIIVDNEEH